MGYAARPQSCGVRNCNTQIPCGTPSKFGLGTDAVTAHMDGDSHGVFQASQLIEQKSRK